MIYSSSFLSTMKNYLNENCYIFISFNKINLLDITTNYKISKLFLFIEILFILMLLICSQILSFILILYIHIQILSFILILIEI